MSNLTDDFLTCFYDCEPISEKGARVIFECQKCGKKYAIDVVSMVRVEKEAEKE